MERRAFMHGAVAFLAWLAACRGEEAPVLPDLPAVEPSGPSTFHAVYDVPRQRDRFFLFLQNVFRLYPEVRFHQLIVDLTEKYPTDEQIYKGLLEGLKSIKPMGSEMTYALPALKKQKKEMARQAGSFLAGMERVDGYLEMGTTGRYLKSLENFVSIEGPIFILNDQSPTFGPVDVFERGSVKKRGTFVPLGAYEPVDGSAIPDSSVDLVSNLIGFHHCPSAEQAAFIGSLRRVLRPGGRLLVREHDVPDEGMDDFVALAHDVFNAGVGISWADNEKQLRGFRSVAEWTTFIEAQGFSRSPSQRVQDHDPTDNTLLEFIKV